MGGRFHFSSIITLRVVTSLHTPHQQNRSNRLLDKPVPAAPPLRSVHKGKISTSCFLLVGDGVSERKMVPILDPAPFTRRCGCASGGRQLQIIVADGAAIVTAISE